VKERNKSRSAASLEAQRVRNHNKPTNTGSPEAQSLETQQIKKRSKSGRAATNPEAQQVLKRSKFKSTAR
jgi:hypothetical protein